MKQLVLTVLATIVLSTGIARAERPENISLASALVKRMQMPEAQAQDQVERVFSALRAELKAGKSVEVRNFGNFSVRERAVRGRKAVAGAEQKPSPERRKYPHFVSAESLKVELNPKKG